MTTEAILSAIIGLLVLVIGGLAKVMFDHARDCRDFRVSIAKDQGSVHEKLDRMARDIGDGDTGLRGGLHKLRNDMSPFVIWAQMQMERGRER